MREMSSPSLATFASRNSNSGATFQLDAGLFRKAGGVEEAEKLRDQMIWLGSLPEMEQRAFPLLHYGRWGAAGASYWSEHLQAEPASSLWQKRPSQEICAAVGAAARWLSGSLHTQVGDSLPCLYRLVEQTEGRLLRLAVSSGPMVSVLQENGMNINGLSIPSPLNLLSEARRAAQHLSLEASTAVRLHGDFHLGNLLVSETTPTRWWLIDPRGRFTGGTQYFDHYYDWGKLFHDLYGLYNLAVEGRVSARRGSSQYTQIHLAEDEPGRLVYAALRRSLLSVLDELERPRGGLQARKLLLYVGLLTLGAVPFHVRHVERSMVLLCAGSIALHQACRFCEDDCRDLLAGDFASSLIHRGQPMSVVQSCL